MQTREAADLNHLEVTVERFARGFSWKGRELTSLEFFHGEAGRAERRCPEGANRDWILWLQAGLRPQDTEPGLENRHFLLGSGKVLFSDACPIPAPA